MKIYARCAQCIEQNKNPIVFTDFKTYEIPVNDEGIYEFICVSGHKNTLISHHEKYEVLFQMGAEAFVDGYYFEAVSCFITSLERFREWFIKLLSRVNKTNIEDYDFLWKTVMSSSSERQAGAFYLMLLNNFNEKPLIFPEKQVAFRNKVLHKGIIPDKKNTFEFGECVMNYIREIQKKVYPKHKVEIWEMENEKMHKPLSGYTSEQIMSREATIFNGLEWILDIPLSIQKENLDFESELEKIRKIRGSYLHN